METSLTITKIAAALLKAQTGMGNAVKDSTNPFFKSKYADLNSVREACLPLLNANGISAIQPMISKDGKNYINTILLHESGEFLSSLTEIIYLKQNDAQAQGSGITYARRYGLQAFVNIGAADDDGAKASQPTQAKVVEKPKEIPKQNEPIKKSNATEKQVEKLIENIKQGIPVDISAYENVLIFSSEQKTKIGNAFNNK
jgi:hypothetical protein